MAYAQPNTISGEISAAPHNANYAYIINALNAYDGSNISNATVPAAALASDSVTTAKIKDANVTTAKIADDNITNAKLDHTDGHLVFTPDTSKLVKIAVLQQSLTVDAYKNNSVILTGWGYITGTNADRNTTTVTMGLTFDTLASMVILVSSLGLTPASATPDTLDDFSSVCNTWWNMYTLDITTSTFKVYAEQRSTGAGNTQKHGFSWIAIGVIG